MTLQDVCEPLLLYVCRVNRAARKGATVEYAEVRRQVEDLLSEIRLKASAEPGLRAQYERIADALTFFVDSMIAESDLPFASQWHANRLAYEQNERAGDDKFFDILDELLVDRNSEVVPCLVVLFTCLGLGFEGCYAGAQEDINAKMLECASRIREHMDKDADTRLCPEAYEHLDTRDLIQPPGTKVGAIAVAFAGALLVLFIASWVFYGSFTSEMSRALDDIQHPEKAVEREMGS